MHDFYLAKQILDEVVRAAKKNRLKKIKRVVIGLGSFVEHDEEILPDNLKNNFRLLAKNTIAESAELVIKKLNKNNHWELVEIDGSK